jgi:type II secretory ATPase GspE/PulE/Tfp pilus assembly ATPase PilB-like protein
VNNPRTRKRLGDLLVDEGVITATQLSELLQSRMEVDGRLERVGEAAIRLGYASADEIGMLLANQLGLEYLAGPALRIDLLLARRMPASLAERHLVMPLWQEGDTVTVACVDPTNIVALDDVRAAVGARRLNIVVAPTYALRKGVEEAFGLESQRDGLLGAMELPAEDEPDDVDEFASIDDGPVIRLADDILTSAIRARASDVHIEPKVDRCIVRHRIDGVLHEAMSLPRSVAAPLVSRIKLIAGLDIAEKRKPQDGRSHFRGAPGRNDEAVDLRLSTLPSLTGESIVIRILRRDADRHDMANTGLSDTQAAHILSVVERPQGLVLVTGPTGSGKTSSLYALLSHLATNERKLITVEDPVEYELGGIVQTQVNERAGYDLSRALRAMLRQDPDVVMVGEIRDPDTAELALQASLTGHLVLSTLHTNDAPSAVVRLSELGMPGYLIASALTMVIAQRLVRRVCPHCSVAVAPTDRQRQRLGLRAEAGTFLIGQGCASCNQTGYLGRTGLYEILSVDGPVRELIAEGASTAAISQAARHGGLRGLREDGIKRAMEGITTLDEVIRVTPGAEHLDNLCPICAKEVEHDYAICPWCAADLRPFRCATCERSLDGSWVACPSCGTPTREAAPPVRPGLPRVLVVDDDPSVRSAVEAMLTGDYEVVHAGSGEEALAMVHTANVDVVVLDKGLQDMDGYDVAREIRARPTVRDLPILVITGHDSPEVETEGLRAGADDWIAKPIDMDILLARLHRLVARTVGV